MQHRGEVEEESSWTCCVLVYYAVDQQLWHWHTLTSSCRSAWPANCSKASRCSWSIQLWTAHILHWIYRHSLQLSGRPSFWSAASQALGENLFPVLFVKPLTPLNLSLSLLLAYASSPLLSLASEFWFGFLCQAQNSSWTYQDGKPDFGKPLHHHNFALQQCLWHCVVCHWRTKSRKVSSTNKLAATQHLTRLKSDGILWKAG